MQLEYINLILGHLINKIMIDYFDNIKASVDISFNDWPGEISTVLFFGGCNFRCPFCINRELAFTPEKCDDIPFKHFVDLWKNYDKLELLNHVVLCGGEPIIYPKIFELCDYFKNNLGMKIKLDTNGSRPETIGALLDRKLIDFVAMDIKASLGYKEDYDLYAKSVGLKSISLADIVTSIKYIIKSGVRREFRVVKHDLLNESHFKKIKTFIKEMGGDPEEVVFVECKKYSS